LLRASAAGDQPSPVFPPGPSQDDRTATRRAVSKLRERRLIVVPDETMRLTRPANEKQLAALKRKYAVLRLAVRTELGEEVVRELRSELRTPGTRIRWLPRLEKIEAATIARCPNCRPRPEPAPRSQRHR
jgi:hypothetical protein